MSRITVRRALEELERQGQVVRSKGKSARVAQPLLAHARTNLGDDFITMLDLVRGTVPEIVLFEWQLPTEEIASRLELTGKEPVLRVDRVRTMDSRPMMHTVAYVPAFIGVKLEKEDLTKSSMLEILSQSGIIPVHVEQLMSAVPSSESIAAYLKMDVGGPVFQLDRLVKDDAGRPIQSLSISFRGDSFTYHLSATFDENSKGVEIASTTQIQPALERPKRRAAKQREPVGQAKSL